MFFKQFFNTTITTPEASFPTDGLVARWQFEDNIEDSYGSWDLTTPPGSFSTDAMVGKSGYYTGQESKYNTNLNSYFLGTSSWSFSCWLKGDVSNSPVILAYDGIDIPPYTRIWLQINADYTIMLQRFNRPDCGNQSSVECGISSSNVFTDWAHIVWVYNNANHVNGTYIYVNNTQNSITTNTNWSNYGNANLVTSVNATGLTISGNNQNNRSPLNQVYIDQAYFYSKALSSDEVSQLYNSGNGI